MTKLFFRLCKAEGFVDFVPLTFVADERTYIALVPENARYHSRVPEILLGNVILRIIGFRSCDAQLRFKGIGAIRFLEQGLRKL